MILFFILLVVGLGLILLHNRQNIIQLLLFFIDLNQRQLRRISGFILVLGVVCMLGSTVSYFISSKLSLGLSLVFLLAFYISGAGTVFRIVRWARSNDASDRSEHTRSLMAGWLPFFGAVLILMAVLCW